MKRLFAINLWPYVTEQSSLTSLSSACSLASSEFIIGESALMPLLAHQETIDKISFAPAYIQWTHLRILHETNINSEVVARLLPKLDKYDADAFLTEYYDSRCTIRLPEELMNILRENCIRWGFSDTQETHLFLSRIIRFWTRYFSFFRVDRVVACMSPHSLEDLACFLVSLTLKIRTYSFVGGCVNTTLIMCWNTRSPLPLQTDSPMKRDVETNVRSYFRKNNAGDVGFGRAYVGTMAQEYKLGLRIAKQSLMHDLVANHSDQSIAYYHCEQLERYRGYSLNYEQIKNMTLNSGRSIYFPLHSQPEATTVPCAFDWHDQLKAIKHVRAQHTEEWPMFIKEHPYQFLTIGELPASLARKVAAHVRPKDFYDQIIQLPNTHLVDLNVPLKLILEELQPIFVNITGSSGMEAYSKNLDVLQLPNTINPYGILLERAVSKSGLYVRECDAQIYFQHYSVARPQGYTLKAEMIGTGDLFEYLSFSLADQTTRCSWASIVGFLLKSVTEGHELLA